MILTGVNSNRPQFQNKSVKGSDFIYLGFILLHDKNYKLYNGSEKGPYFSPDLLVLTWSRGPTETLRTLLEMWFQEEPWG